MSGDQPRVPILKGSDVVRIVDDQERSDVVSFFPTLRPGDVLKITESGDLGDVGLGQLVAIREVEYGEPALSVDVSSEAKDAVQTAGVVGARVKHIQNGTMTLEITDSADMDVDR